MKNWKDINRTPTQRAIPPRRESGEYSRTSSEGSKDKLEEQMRAASNSLALPIADPHRALEYWKSALAVAVNDHDSINQARIHSNMGSVYRHLGNLQNAKFHMDRAWHLTTLYLKASAATQQSNWVQMAVKATGLQTDLDDSFPANFSESDIHRWKSGLQIASGPPIVVWVLQLMTNIGNLCFVRGQYDSAIKCHGISKKLVDIIFEEYPPPFTILKCSLEANSGRSITNNGKPAKSKEQFQLSYLHKHAISAQISALNNLGACYAALGHISTSLQYYYSAEHLLSRVSQYVPGFVPNKLGPRISSANANSTTEFLFNSGMMRHNACIKSNMGLAYRMIGDYANALTLSQQGLQMFEQYGTFCHRLSTSVNRRLGTDEIRQLSTISALHAEIGRAVFNGHWIQAMEQLKESGDLNSAKLSRFWPETKAKFDMSRWLPAELMIDSSLASFYLQSFRQKIIGDWTGLYVNYINIASCYLEMNKPELAFHYIAKAVDGIDKPQSNGDSKSKPALPPFLYPNIHRLLTKILIFVYKSDQIEFLPRDMQAVEQFLLSTVRNQSFNIFNVTKEGIEHLLSFQEHNLAELERQSALPIVNQHGTINFPIPTSNKNEKLHILKSKLFRIKLITMKFHLNIMDASVMQMESVKEVLKFLRSFFQLKANSGLPYILLTKIADHIESNEQSKLVHGMLSWKEYALCADLLAYSHKHPRLDIHVALKFSPHSLADVRAGLLEAAAMLFLASLGICEKCFEVGGYGDYVERDSCKKFEPCVHGFRYLQQ